MTLSSLLLRWGPFALASLLLWALTVWAATTLGDWWAR